MRKLVYIDVGTHQGQEFKSIFGKNSYFYSKIILSSIKNFFLFGKVILPFRSFIELLMYRTQLRKAQNDFLFYFVEANPLVICRNSVYFLAHGVFSLALTKKQQDAKIERLFLVGGDRTGQGSSIFLGKSNVSEGTFVPTFTMSSHAFFDELRRVCDAAAGDYLVILRVNCEGAEDDVIYAAQEVFGKRLVSVMGSLKDVGICKGEAALEKLYAFLLRVEIPFTFFSPGVESWPDAHRAICALVTSLNE